MADRTIKILTAATKVSFLSLEEAKALLGGVVSGEDDATLQLMLDINSSTIMRLCNRIMAFEEVDETWREVGSRRLFLSHWPVKTADIQSVESPRGTLLDPSLWELEEGSGKLSRFDGPWVDDSVVIYSGGYNLPDDAPLPLKQATALAVREQRALNLSAAVSGIRSLGYREKRVQFYDTTKMGGTSAAQKALSNLLTHYTRWEV